MGGAKLKQTAKQSLLVIILFHAFCLHAEVPQRNLMVGEPSTTVDSFASPDRADVVLVNDDGTRSEEGILAVMELHKVGVYAIYTRALRKVPELAGKVSFELVIESDGSVSECKVLTSELNQPALEAKFVARIKLIDFGAYSGPQQTIRWALGFYPM